MLKKKFRIFNGIEMVYDVMIGKFGAFYVNPSNNGISEKDNACLSELNTKYPDDVPVMQYVGIEDKNDRDVYEKDIIETTDYMTNKKTRHVVTFESETCESRFGFGSIDWYKTEIEIIGNIYENPELLKQDDDNLIKFDLEKALNGEEVITRTGLLVTDLHLFDIDDSEHSKFVLGAVVENHDVIIYKANGKYLMTADSPLDLFMKSKDRRKREYWANLFRFKDGSVFCDSATYKSKEEAVEAAGSANSYLRSIKIWEEKNMTLDEAIIKAIHESFNSGIEYERNSSKWISVYEGLPNNDKRVLVTVTNKNMQEMIATATYTAVRKWTVSFDPDDDYNEYDRVTY